VRLISWDPNSLGPMKGNNIDLPTGARFYGSDLVPSRILPSSHARKTIDHRSNTLFDAKIIIIPSFIDFTSNIAKSEPSKIYINYKPIKFG
jgi:hypothetical protein